MRSSSAIALLVVAGAAVTAWSAPRVAIVKSSALGPFNEATAAITETLRRDVLEPEVLTFDLHGDEARAPSILPEVRGAKPALVVTVGSLATGAVLGAADVEAPVVFSMVLYPRESGFLAPRAAGVTGVALDVPLDVQLGAVRRLVPSARRVGVLYHPGETGRIVDAARGAAATLQLELVAQEVDDAAGAVEALEELAPRVDAVWSVADSHVFTPQTTAALILAALRRKLPLVGLSTAHVRAGTLAALVVDYADVGRQTAALALEVLRGARASDRPVAAPRRVRLALNLRTAEHLGLSIDPAMEREAVEVVR